MAQFKVEDEYKYPYEVGVLQNLTQANAFCAQLKAMGIDCAILFRGYHIVCYVAKKEDVSRAKLELVAFFGKFGKKDSSFTQGGRKVSMPFSNYLQMASVRFNLLSVVTAIELLCVISYLLSFFMERSLLSALCLFDIRQITEDFEIYRLITPIFVHFSFMHIAFNLVMFEAFARPIENKIGVLKILSLVIVSALISNALQFLVLMQDLTLFGGMSGVVYATIAYVAMLAKRDDLPSELYIPKGLFTVSVIFIVLGFFISGIANFCHIGGLLVGLVMGFYDSKRLKF